MRKENMMFMLIGVLIGLIMCVVTVFVFFGGVFVLAYMAMMGALGVIEVLDFFDLDICLTREYVTLGESLKSTFRVFLLGLVVLAPFLIGVPVAINDAVGWPYRSNVVDVLLFALVTAPFLAFCLALLYWLFLASDTSCPEILWTGKGGKGSLEES